LRGDTRPDPDGARIGRPRVLNAPERIRTSDLRFRSHRIPGERGLFTRRIVLVRLVARDRCCRMWDMRWDMRRCPALIGRGAAPGRPGTRTRHLRRRKGRGLASSRPGQRSARGAATGSTAPIPAQIAR
jgi:hypothetical protein